MRDISDDVHVCISDSEEVLILLEDEETIEMRKSSIDQDFNEKRWRCAKRDVSNKITFYMLHITYWILLYL